MQRSAKIPAKGSTERTSLCGYFLLAEAGMTYKCKYLLSKVRSCVAQLNYRLHYVSSLHQFVVKSAQLRCIVQKDNGG